MLYIVYTKNLPIQLWSCKEEKSADPNKAVAFRSHLVAAYQKLVKISLWVTQMKKVINYFVPTSMHGAAFWDKQ